ncbi:MAG: hypothetical protein A4S09_03815 [Proteobacteria bacterium SG_bin7]|nr:MAG: hypothetical protein A4S09_03815 [Proteobacteria bacterium SG_bin7]
MKKILFFAVTMIALNSGADHTVETLVEKVFVPPTGFDSNDNVLVMLDGTLANQCQQVSDTDVRFDSENKVFYVRQMARVRSTKECHRSPLPRHLGLPGYFSKEISFGVLSPGEYRVEFRGSSGWSSRSFVVSETQTESTDDEIYAPVSNFFVPEMMDETESVQIVLTGVIGSRCLDWKSVEIERFNDIIVVKPKMQIVSTKFCSITPWPLEKIISLGKLKAGRYMVHVRSMNGQGLSRMFSILPDVTDVRGGGY